MDYEELVQNYWPKALELMENSFMDAIFESNIKPLVPLSAENNTVTLKSPLDVFKHSINKRYLQDISRFLSKTAGIDVEVIIVSPEDFGEAVVKSNPGHYSKTNLKSKYVFETFVKGKNNEMACAAAKAVAEAPGGSTYNPLFLYGGVGLGKTHLMQAIGNYVIEQHPGLKVLYVSTETFTNEFIQAIREESVHRFKNTYREVDLLLLDDIQFLEGKDATQGEMFHTFNALYNEGKQIVMTCDLPPNELTNLEKRLTSRFGAGLTVDITLPDYETRAAILDKKLGMERLTVPSEVKDYISKNIVSNIRDLEGALNKVTAFAKLTGTPITLELTENALKDMLSGMQKPPVTIPFIQETVASHFKLTLAELNGRKRTQNIVMPRQIAMYLSRKMLDVSLPEVGEFFGGRDHTTVIHSCDKIAGEVEIDESVRAIVYELEQKIRG
ncbi:MAG: chromosomal replication initiator protein DnaA [Defluviitaleaceae bacterium]|nr:chromosomal replication initiator protein DnaA [Defluviitaleaceae bacterium]